MMQLPPPGLSPVPAPAQPVPPPKPKPKPKPAPTPTPKPAPKPKVLTPAAGRIVYNRVELEEDEDGFPEFGTLDGEDDDATVIEREAQRFGIRFDDCDFED
jgi:hypothetical protein